VILGRDSKGVPLKRKPPCSHFPPVGCCLDDLLNRDEGEVAALSRRIARAFTALSFVALDLYTLLTRTHARTKIIPGHVCSTAIIVLV
jgi:hypothetical protein